MLATSVASDQGLGVVSFLADPKKIRFFQKYRLWNQWKYRENERIPHASENITIEAFLYVPQTLITRWNLCLWIERLILLLLRKSCTIFDRAVNGVRGSFGDARDLALEGNISHLTNQAHLNEFINEGTLLEICNSFHVRVKVMNILIGFADL